MRASKNSRSENCLSLLSYERKPLLSATVYIRHTSESLSSAFFAPLRSNFTLSSQILSSLYPCASSSDLFAHRCRLQAPENPTHILSVLTLARGRILEVMPTEKISFWNSNDGYNGMIEIVTSSLLHECSSELMVQLLFNDNHGRIRCIIKSTRSHRIL